MKKIKMNELLIQGLDLPQNTINLFFHKDSVVFENKGFSCVNVKDGKLISIPFNIVITDAFQNKILTPLNELGYITDADYISLTAWKISNTWINNDCIQAYLKSAHNIYTMVLNYRPISLQIGLNLLLGAVAYTKIVDLNTTFVNNAINEMLTYADLKQKNKDINECDLIFFETIHEIIFDELNNFWLNYISKLKPITLALAITHLMQRYEDISKSCTKTVAKGTKESIIFTPDRFKNSELCILFNKEKLL